MSKKRTPEVEAAIQAFYEAERVQLLLDKKQRSLRAAVLQISSQEELIDYVEETQKIIFDFEEKRMRAGL